jgi:hypothetical protein
MRRFVVILLLATVATSIVGCSTETHWASTVVLPVCVPEGADATFSSTTTAPCTPTTTTSTPLPAPTALGASTILAEGTPPDVASSQITISRIWSGVTPEVGNPGFDLSSELRFLRAPTRLEWIGIDIVMANIGQKQIEFASPTGSGIPYLSIVVNGHDPGFGSSVFPQLGFAMGVAGCPYPFPTSRQGLAPGVKVGGCLAIPVPAGLRVSTVGFDLSYPGGVIRNVAQWHT